LEKEVVVEVKEDEKEDLSSRNALVPIGANVESNSSEWFLSFSTLMDSNNKPWATTMRNMGKFLTKPPAKRLEAPNALSGANQDPHVLHAIKGHELPILCVAHDNSRLLATGGCDNTVKIWGLQTKTCANTFNEHRGKKKTIKGFVLQ